MALIETKRTNNGSGQYTREFICDFIVDIVNMPGLDEGVHPGSTMKCLENKKDYILSVAGQWVEYLF